MLKAECVTNGIQTTSVCMYTGVIINELATGIAALMHFKPHNYKFALSLALQETWSPLEDILHLKMLSFTVLDSRSNSNLAS